MQCVFFTTFTVAPGSFVLAATGQLYIADPCNMGDTVLMSSGEVALMKSQMIETAFHLTNESAVAIGGAILLTMAAAFVLRLVRKSLESSES